MYSDAGDTGYGKYTVTGDIEFGMAYNYKQSTLEVLIKRCRGIAAVDTKKNSSDPSVSTIGVINVRKKIKKNVKNAFFIQKIKKKRL